MKRIHWIITVSAKDQKKANEICVEIFNPAAIDTFTVPLVNEKEEEQRFCCGWWLSDKEKANLEKGFTSASISSTWHDSSKDDFQAVQETLKLHIKKEEKLA